MTRGRVLTENIEDTEKKEDYGLSLPLYSLRVLGENCHRLGVPAGVGRGWR